MKRILILVTLCLAALGLGEETYLGLYLQGNKLGYAAYSDVQATLDGKPAKRSDSKTVINAGLLGASMQMEIISSSWTDSKGRPLRMDVTTTSAGRTQKMIARFVGQKINVDIDNSGTKSKKTLTIPPGGQVIDDPLTPIVAGTVNVGAKKTFYILDPTTVSLVKNEVVLRGPSTVKVRDKDVQATKVEIIDPRANTVVYITSKGDLVKAEGPMGIEMIPETKEEALSTTAPTKPTDLAEITKIRPDKAIEDPAHVGFLKLRLTGKDLKNVPSDGHQTVATSDGGWILTVHPPKLSDSAGVTIAQAAKGQPAWTKPSTLIPSDSKQFKTLAKKIVGNETNAKKAALKIKDYVQRTMSPNAGIGVLRDATEIVKTKEGVCRDYAILSATIMRAAGIPTRLCSGLVNWDGSFYYHAWVEIWDGKRWLGMDSTTPDPQISAAHIKLGDGNVDEAFTFPLLENVKIQILEAKRW